MSIVKIPIASFHKIKEAIQYNSSTSISFARNQSKEILKILHKGNTIEIEELDITLNNIEEYKAWKKDKEYLNLFNTDILLSEIKEESEKHN